MEPISSQEAIPDAPVSKFLEDMMPTKLFWRKSKQFGREEASKQSSNESWVFWSQEASTYCEIQQRIITALSEDWLFVYVDPLVQFWAAEMIGDQLHLTTTLQPFALCNLTDGKLIQYRKFCVGLQGENMDGILGRVFRNQLLELSHDLSYYSVTEYPQRDLALSCGFKSTMVLPVLDPSQRFCVGVLELLCPTYFCKQNITIHFLISNVNRMLKKVHLETIEGPQLRSQIQNIFEIHVANEIHCALKTICEKYELPFASVWVRGAYIGCVDHDSFSHTSYNDFQVNFRVSCEGALLLSAPNISTLSNTKLFPCYYTTLSVPLTVRQGLAGKAVLSRKPYLCRDVCELSIIDYPLAHCVRKSGLAGCFAVCLRTISTGNHEYVIEFFLPENKTYGDLHSYMSSILTTMKHHFRTFEVVTGDIGNDLFIEVDKFTFHKEVESFSEFPTTNTQLEFEALQNDGEVLQSDRSIDHQLVIEDIDVLEQHGIAISSESIPLVNQAQSLEKKSSCSRKDLEQHFGKKLNDAADILGVSRSTLKRLCREHNIMRWPSPKRSKICSLSSIPKQKDVLTQGDVEPISKDAGRDPSCSEPPTNVALMPATSTVTVKATYGEKNFKFKLSYSSRMADLEEKVIMRTRLGGGMFSMTYLDEENDLVSVACDEDLHDCMVDLRLSGKSTIRMQIEPTANKSP